MLQGGVPNLHRCIMFDWIIINTSCLKLKVFSIKKKHLIRTKQHIQLPPPPSLKKSCDSGKRICCAVHTERILPEESSRETEGNIPPVNRKFIAENSGPDY